MDFLWCNGCKKIISVNAENESDWVVLMTDEDEREHWEHRVKSKGLKYVDGDSFDKLVIWGERQKR